MVPQPLVEKFVGAAVLLQGEAIRAGLDAEVPPVALRNEGGRQQPAQDPGEGHFRHASLFY